MKHHLLFPAAVISVAGLLNASSATAAPEDALIIEAENFIATTAGPGAANCATCSGGMNLGNYFFNSSVDLQVNVPISGNYTIMLSVASESNTEINIQLVDGDQFTNLATSNLPRTIGFDDYVEYSPVVVALPAGSNTLRLTNVGLSTNIDYVALTPSSNTVLVTTRPPTNEGPDKNPLKGFNSGWWNPGQENWASVGYQAIEWRDFERCVDSDGKALLIQSYERCNNQWDWAEIERIIERPGSIGRHLVLQLVVDLPGKAEEVDAATGIVTRRQGFAGPEWLRTIAGERRDPNQPKNSATEYDDRFFQDQAIEAITALIDRYRDDPRVFVIQTGVLGFYGEWQTFPYNGQIGDRNPQGLDWSPSLPTMDNILGTYLDNLSEVQGQGGIENMTGTYTQVRYPDQEANVVRARPGMGYVNGYVVQTSHGTEFGDKTGDPARQLWNNGPIGGEWPPSNNQTLVIDNPDAEQECKLNRSGETRSCWELFLDEEGEEFIRNGRYTHVLPPENPSRRVDATHVGWKGDSRFMRLHRLFGYNFQVEEIRHSTSASNATYLEVDLGNVGIAPFYEEWELQLAILDSATKEPVGSVVVDADIRTLGPNESTTVSATIDAQLLSGSTYEIALRIQQPNEPLSAKLDPRNLYVVLANDVDVVAGKWQNDSLVGGWNILDTVKLSSQPIETGQSPVLQALSDVSVNEGESVTVTLASTDADGNDLTLSAKGLPNFCDLSDYGDGTGAIDCVPGLDDMGAYNIGVFATDTSGLTDEMSFKVNVISVDQTPTCGGLPVTIEWGPGVSATNGDDVIMGTPGADTINGMGGDDVICGNSGDDLLYGAAGVDVLYGGTGNDRLVGNRGSDSLYGGDGNDALFGGKDSDTLSGDSGDDKLFGARGDDVLNGGDGDDKLHGGPDNDQLFGDGGDDYLNGSFGDDICDGGTNDELAGDRANASCETVASIL